jgi:hypothetical protein
MTRYLDRMNRTGRSRQAENWEPQKFPEVEMLK